MDRSYIYIYDTWVTINSIFTIDEPSIPMYFYENSFKYETKELYSFPVINEKLQNMYWFIVLKKN